jgi:hypothetical protein
MNAQSSGLDQYTVVSGGRMRIMNVRTPKVITNSIKAFRLVDATRAMSIASSARAGPGHSAPSSGGGLVPSTLLSSPVAG